MKKNTEHESEERGVSLLAFDQYMREVKRLPKLSREEEAELFERILHARREPENQGKAMLADDARDRLVQRYQYLVIFIARKFHRWCRHLELLDLIQEGNLGLLHALERHEPGEGHDLVTFVNTCVHQAIIALVRDRDPLVRMPKNVARDVGWLMQEQRQLEAYLGREPTPQQLAEQMKLPLKRVLELLDWSVYRHVSSIQALIAEESDEDQMRFMAVRPVVTSSDALEQETRRQAVRQAVEALPQRQRQVISLRYSFDADGQTVRSWHTVGEMVGLSNRSASASEYVARRQLRRQLAALCAAEPQEVAS